MKTILKTLIVAAAFLIQTNCVKGQYTYQTAKRFSYATLIATDSNQVLQPGIGLGCDTIVTQPAWMWMGFCGSGNLNLEFNASTISLTPIGKVGVVFYGPFTDTLNLSSKLVNANIDTCFIRPVYSSTSWYSILPNYQRGNIYYVLFTSTTNVTNVTLDYGITTPQWGTDPTLCPLCNSQISQLSQNICTITYDSASQKNKLIWAKDIFTPAQDYVIFRKNAAGTLDTLAFQSISQLSEYVDVTSSPLSKLYEYKMGIRDSCGQFIANYISYPYTSFTTMHLIAYPTGNNSSGLIWNPGSFQGPFFIYRTDPSGITTLIDSIGLVSGTQTYTDINAPAGMCSYQIGVRLTSPCVPSLLPSYNIVKSNPGFVTVTAINELTDLSKSINIEPNPFNQYTKIDLHLIQKQNLKVVLRSITGQALMQYNDVKEDALLIEKNNLSQGIYILEVTGNGFYARKKVVVD